MRRRWLWGPLLGSLLLTACQGAVAGTSGGAAANAPAASAAQPVRELKVGDVAPDFTLQNQNRQDTNLSQFRGRPVQVAFYVWAFSPG